MSRVTIEAIATSLGQRLRRTNAGSVWRVRAGSRVGQGYKKTQVRGGDQSASIRQAIVCDSGRWYGPLYVRTRRSHQFVIIIA